MARTYPGEIENLGQYARYGGGPCMYYTKSQMKVGGRRVCARGMRETGVDKYADSPLVGNISPNMLQLQCISEEVKADLQGYCATQAISEALASVPVATFDKDVDRTSGLDEPLM